MNNTQLSQTVLNAWIQDYQQLHDILNAEQAALEKRDFDRLQQLIKEKDETVTHINTHQVPAIANERGLKITHLGEFKQLCVANSELKEVWTEMIQLVEKCCLKNEVNARLIKLVETSSKRTFNLIKGFDPDNNIYNSSGNRSTVRYYSDSLSA